MLEILVQIIPLSIASTLSPGIVAIMVALLCGKNRPMLKALAFAFGGLLSVLVLTSGVVSVLNGANPPAILKSPEFAIVFGVVLVLFGIHSAFEKPYGEKEIETKKRKFAIPLLIALGFLVNITNFDAVLLYLTELKMIYFAGLADNREIILTSFCAFMFLLPSTFPIIARLAFPASSQEILDHVRKLLKKYGNALMAGLFIIFGLVFIWKGMNGG
jgi:threonine/homoserine/homoserine lactone efflux protein